MAISSQHASRLGLRILDETALAAARVIGARIADEQFAKLRTKVTKEKGSYIKRAKTLELSAGEGDE